MSTPAVSATWQSQVPNAPSPLVCAIPPEFDGPGGGYSPEDFYALALANCYTATFQVFAEKSNLRFEQLEVGVELIVDRDEKGRPWMAKALFQVRLQCQDLPEKAQRLLVKTSESCLVLNSVRTEKVFEFNLQS